jgi:hypothetical protein|tara:strand:+ start:233 stop:433 length:201 start_codon:yes stop_codon:yes gene_type:complete
MKRERNYKYYSNIITKIENVRKKNNKNWMDLLKLGFRYNPRESKKILKEIFKEDKKVNSLVKKLVK